MNYIPVRGYEGYYSICEEGDVVSHYYGISLKHGKSAGYPVVHLYKGRKSKTHSIHRLLAEHFIDNLDNLPVVNHKNGNIEDFCLGNLEWATVAYNVQDGFNRGRIHPQQGKRYVDRKKVCEWCHYSFDYVKKRQRFCSKKCSNAYARSRITTEKKRDDMGRYIAIALDDAGVKL